MCGLMEPGCHKRCAACLQPPHKGPLAPQGKETKLQSQPPPSPARSTQLTSFCAAAPLLAAVRPRLRKLAAAATCPAAAGCCCCSRRWAGKAADGLDRLLAHERVGPRCDNVQLADLHLRNICRDRACRGLGAREASIGCVHSVHAGTGSEQSWCADLVCCRRHSAGRCSGLDSPGPL